MFFLYKVHIVDMYKDAIHKTILFSGSCKKKKVVLRNCDGIEYEDLLPYGLWLALYGYIKILNTNELNDFFFFIKTDIL